MADEIDNRTADLESTLMKLQNRRDPSDGKVSEPRRMPEFKASITRRATSPAFPEVGPVQQVTQSTAAASGHYSFQLFNASEGNSPKVLIMDGEVNGEVPTGMGNDDYELDVYDGAFINLIVTYDSVSLAITSLTFEVNFEVPDPSVGTFYIEIGRTYVDYDDNGNISSFTPVNTQCGDINFQLIYGSKNGLPAIIPVAAYSTFVQVT